MWTAVQTYRNSQVYVQTDGQLHTQSGKCVDTEHDSMKANMTVLAYRLHAHSVRLMALWHC